MKFKFWQRETGGAGAPRMSKPKELPDEIGRYLVVTLKKDPDWIWGLMAVYRDRAEGGSARDMLVFDPRAADAKGVEILNYDGLLQHPDLVVFQGWYDKGQGTFEIKPPMNTAAA